MSSSKLPIMLLALALIFSCQVMMTESVLPGFQMRITKKGLDYANNVAHNVLTKEMKTLKIPNVSGSSGHIEWSLSNVQTRSYSVPSSSMTFTPSANALSWGLNNLALSIHADWRVKYHKGWVKISTSGSADVSVSQVSLQVGIKLGTDAQGRPSISMASCSAHIGNVDIHFHGGTAFILNLFRHVLEDKVKDMLNDQICKIVSKEVNVDGESQMKKIAVTILMDHRFLLDYRLVSAPLIQTSYLETKHKGEVFWKTEKTEAPFAPAAIPEKGDDSRMVNLWMTQYMANTYAYVAQKNDFLKYNLTASDLPGNQSFLNTTCSAFKCIGSLIPQIAKKCPNCLVEIHMSSTAAPVMTISDKSVGVAMKGNLDFYAKSPKQEMVYLLTLNVSMGLALNATIVNERVMGDIVSHSFKIGIVKSAVGDVDAKALNFIFNIALELRILPMLKSILKTGAQLPVTGAVKFQNTNLATSNGYLMITTDLLYTKGMRSKELTFLSERKVKSPFLNLLKGAQRLGGQPDFFAAE